MKVWIQILTIGLCLLLFLLPVRAKEATEQYIDETLEEFGDRLEDRIPEEAEEFLEELDLTELNWRQILSLDPADLLRLIGEKLADSCREPVKILAQTTGILLLCSLLCPMKESLLNNETGLLFNLVSVACLSITVCEPVIRCMEQCMTTLKNSSLFLLSLIPVLCSILTVGGQAVTATGYQLLLFTVCQLISQLALSVALPLMNIYFALSLVSAVFHKVGLQGICNGIRQMICWGLGIITTLFVGFLSMQTFVSSSVDVVTLKASRFLMGSFIPVVGSILSEAFGAAQGCISLLKGTVGSFGIIVALCTILPILLKVILWYFVTWIGVQLSNILQVQESGAILKAANNTFAVLLAILLCFSLLVVVATTLVIFIGTGG